MSNLLCLNCAVSVMGSRSRCLYTAISDCWIAFYLIDSLDAVYLTEPDGIVLCELVLGFCFVVVASPYFYNH